MLSNFLKLDELSSNVRTEVIAGLTTFVTMAYIIFVNPKILSGAEMDGNAVFVATCLTAAIGSALLFAQLSHLIHEGWFLRLASVV